MQGTQHALALELAVAQPGVCMRAQIIHRKQALYGMAQQDFTTVEFHTECFSPGYILLPRHLRKYGL